MEYHSDLFVTEDFLRDAKLDDPLAYCKRECLRCLLDSISINDIDTFSIKIEVFSQYTPDCPDERTYERNKRDNTRLIRMSAKVLRYANHTKD